MFSALSTVQLSLSFLSVIAMAAACLAVGFMAAKPARHPVAVADVLGRSGRVHLGIIAAGVLGVLIALIAEHGLPTKQHDEDSNGE